VLLYQFGLVRPGAFGEAAHAIVWIALKFNWMKEKLMSRSIRNLNTLVFWLVALLLMNGTNANAQTFRG